MLSIFLCAIKLWEITARFFFLLHRNIRKHSIPFSLLPVNGAIDQSRTPLGLMLRPPSTKVTFVRFDLADWTLSGNKAQNKTRNKLAL